MKRTKHFKLFLLLAIMFSSYYSMGQSTCATAVTDTMTSNNHYRTHQINRDSVFWVKFTATAVKCKIRIKSILNQTPPTVTRLTLYSGTCNSLTTLSVRNFATQDSLFLIYDGLNINTVYYLKINNSNTADTCHFNLGLLSVITKFDPILYNCDENLICFNKLDDGNFDLSGPPFVFSSNLALTPIWFPWGLYSIYNVVPNAHDARSIWTGYGFDNGGGPDDFFVADGFDWGGTFNTAWTENVTVTAGATYYFSFAVSNVDNNEILDPVVQFWISGAPVQINNIASDTYHVPWGHNVWQQLCGEWTAPGSGTYSVPIAIMDTVEDGDAGNDFGLDHIVFGPLIPIAEAGNNDTICLGESTVLMATGGNAYHWSPATGLSCTNCQNPVASPTTTTTYTVTVYNDACESYDMVTVYVIPKPDIPIISGQYNTCHGTPPITINNIDNWTAGCTYHYFIGAGGAHHLITSTPFNVTWTNIQTGGMLYVEVENNTTHCTALDSFKVFKCCIDTSTRALIADLTITSPTTYVGNYHVNGTIVIDADVNIGGANPGFFHMAPNARIIINPGRTLTILRKSVLSAYCDTMWDGIYINGTTAHLVLKDTSAVRDAKNAIVSNNGGDFQLSNSDTLRNNYKNIVVNSYSGGTHPGRISKTTIKCNATLLPMYPPPLVIPTRTLSGIEVDTVYRIYIGDTTALSKRNTFDNMENGINAVQTNIYVYNNKFLNINAQVTPNNPIYGKAIYIAGAKNSTNSATIGAANVLPNTVRSNYFNNCYYGIHLSSVLNFIKAEYDTMVEQTYSGVAANGIYAYAESISNATIRHNKITNGAFGINYVNMLANSTMNISSNYVEKAQTGIAVTNVNLTAPYDFQIANNSVNYPVAYVNNSTGILVTNVYGGRAVGSNKPFAFISTNTVKFTTPTLANTAYGIRVQNSRYARLELNTVRNTSGTYAPDSLNAIRFNGIQVELSPYAYLCMNKAARMGCGLRFVGTMSTVSNIKVNTMDTTYYGIMLNNAYLGDQGTAAQCDGNKWNGTTPAQIKKRLTGTWTPAYWYYYLPSGNMSLNLALNYVATTPPPIGWVLQATGYLSTCGTTPPQMLMGGGLQDIVNDQINYTSAIAESKYVDKTTAYSMLKNEPDLMSGLSTNGAIYQSFYNNISAGNIGALDKINDLINAGDYSGAQVLNAGITPSNTMEINKKTVNDVYLNTWAQGRFNLTEDEYNTLYGVASQEPVYGGIGVYSARVMIGEPETNLSNKKIINTPENVASPNMAGLIYPNPVTGEANIDYEIKTGNKVILTVYGIAGNKLKEFALNKDETHFSFSTVQFMSGVYFYQLLVDGSVINKNKFIIIK